MIIRCTDFGGKVVRAVEFQHNSESNTYSITVHDYEDGKSTTACLDARQVKDIIVMMAQGLPLVDSQGNSTVEQQLDF